ncbi:isochorismatase family protein [Mitsuaria sp. WAJ17]|uniref:isochorismatase family protein n=1 Tax=Mitsuaria sp. WAJ17 TaxID=2761452 RepID=UPI001602ACB6|nr:isochorismatase family protein [Mitsuaria sp. WAJ17]MBB2485943.1 isochorismatase family protein [Mitsuaria sp. WAJ17]
MSIPPIPSYAMPAVADFPASRVSWGLQPHRAVLLVHDMQDYFLRSYGAHSPLRDTLLQHLQALVHWARANGLPVVYTAQPSTQSPQDRALLNDMWGPGLSAADPSLAGIVKALAPAAGDTVLDKWRYSAFQRSALASLMRQWGRDQLLIGGVYAHIGCLATAVEAFMQDIQPFMVGDAVADFSLDEHQMALRYVAGRAGRVIGTGEVLALGRSSITWEVFRASVLARLPEGQEAPRDDDNLLDHGMDSLMLMELIAGWSRQGMRLRFEDLAQGPSLTAWWALAQKTQAQAGAQA